jgi:periplasmic protein TonB
MVALLAPTPRLALDGKRIAANSVVITLHVAAALLLLAPISRPEPVATPEVTTEITLVEPPIKVIPPPLPPIERVIPQVTPPVPTTRTIEQVLPPTSDVVYDDGSDTVVVDTGQVVPPFTGDTVGPPTIQALMTDRAPAPPYPQMAQSRGIGGTVVLMILVDAGGNPVQVDIEKSSGSSLLDEAAQKFIRARWHFVPAQQGGVAISAYARVPINFQL